MKAVSATLLFVSIAMASCSTSGPSGPATPVQACANLGSDIYSCESNSPGVLVIDGKGAVKLSVVGDNPSQFSQSVNYMPNNYSHPAVTVQNGTGNGNTQAIFYSGTNQSQIHFETPFSDSYTIKAYYIEYGISAPSNASTGNLTTTCFNPATNGCFRWYKFQSVASGTNISCSNNSVIIINQMDPSGFIGNCN